MGFCTKCGKKMRDEWKHCPFCGSELVTQDELKEEFQNKIYFDETNPIERETTRDVEERIITKDNEVEECAVVEKNKAYENVVSVNDETEKIRGGNFSENSGNAKGKSKKTLIIGIITIIVLLFIIALGLDGGYNSAADPNDITTESAAISAAKYYAQNSPLSLEQSIASELGFNNFYSPDIGTCSAIQNSDGSWEVEIHGKMGGYIDEYHSDFAEKKFLVTATVRSEDSVSYYVVDLGSTF